MTVVSSARMDWNTSEIVRECDVCRETFRSRCYPSTYDNQMTARKATAQALADHLAGHLAEDVLTYLLRIHLTYLLRIHQV